MNGIKDFLKMKKEKEKIVMVTCYDYTSALIVDKTEVNCVLVGDSSAMIMQGESNTVFSTVEKIEWYTQAVSRGLQNKFIVADLPFMSYYKSKEKTLEVVEKLMRAGAHAVKLEGGAPEAIEAARAIVATGVPVMGHLGLTPQQVHQLGGFKVQGKTEEGAEQLKKEALALQEAGCFSLVLECVPSTLAESITNSLTIPTIGIGAGPETDGQVLVFHDLLGLQTQLQPKFVKRYLQGAELFQEAINSYAREVRTQDFPSAEYSYGGGKA